MTTTHGPILPGARLGVFGGGQLGRMFAQAAARMGYRPAVFSPRADEPAAQVATDHTAGDYGDTAAVRAFARRCAAVTIEFENVPLEALQAAAEEVPARPGPAALRTAQDRLVERRFLDDQGLPTAPHTAAYTVADVHSALERLGTPLIVKTARFGYDGRGQKRVASADDAEETAPLLAATPALCERPVDFQMELSVLVARSPDGSTCTFGPLQNDHRDHILDVSVIPADVTPAVADRAVALARAVADGLALEGQICVEMFLDRDEALLINELAPRPHNSGHLTIEACPASQFEQQTRAMCGLPLGDMTPHRPAAAMANLLGDLWSAGEPSWSRVLDRPGIGLHLYGKREPRAGRKMGHLTALGADPAEAASAVREARTTLENESGRAADRRARPV